MGDPGTTVAAILAAVDGRASVHARRLDAGGAGAIVDVDGGRVQPTGSAAKLLVLLAYARLVDGGELDPATRVVFTDSDRISGSGVLRHLSSGLQPTLDDLAWLMMTISDNAATDLLLRAVGGAATVNAEVTAAGIDGAVVTAETSWIWPPGQLGMASARGLAAIWAVLADPTAAGYPVAAAERCLAITARHQHLEGLARRVPFSPHGGDVGLPSPTLVWGKSGSYPTVRVDSALVRVPATGRAWVVAVTLDGLADWGGGADSVGQTTCAEVGRLLHDAWSA